MVRHVTAPPAALLDPLPSWVTLVRAENSGPMTLDGTNTWVLSDPDTGDCVVVDPGPLDEAHLTAVLDAVEAVRPHRVTVVTTHGHLDHVEGVPRFVELGTRRWGERWGEMRLRMPGEAGKAGEADEAREGGVAVEGCGARVLRTPGHTADSVSIEVVVRGERAVVSGDTILGRGTTVVAYPDGDLGQYLDSLRSMMALGAVPVLPGHGPALADCVTAAGFYLEHRLARLEQVAAAVAGGARSAAEVVATAYAGVNRELWPAAELSVRAALAYLAQTSEISHIPIDSDC
jgi:glyoxylase-like metal-dependent hydrolase (beta-lactamase superfamily II)